MALFKVGDKVQGRYNWGPGEQSPILSYTITKVSDGEYKHVDALGREGWDTTASIDEAFYKIGEVPQRKYVPQVGDKVRQVGWNAEYEVTAVGKTFLLLYSEKYDEESKYPIGAAWVKIEPVVPLPERWHNAYPGSWSISYGSRWDADNAPGATKRIAVLHIWTDDEGVDHAEIERTP